MTKPWVKSLPVLLPLGSITGLGMIPRLLPKQQAGITGVWHEVGAAGGRLMATSGP